MRLEAFSAAKDPALGAANEDRVVVLGDDLFAVVDGVTDKSGKLMPNGLSRGQFAGRVIESEFCRLSALGNSADLSAAGLVSAVSARLAYEYERLGILDAVTTEPHLRCAAQVAALLRVPGGWRLVVVGDCGVRIDGSERYGAESLGDKLVALWRAAVFEALTAAGASTEEALGLGRSYALSGSARYLNEGARWLDEAAHADLAARSLAAACRHFPGLEPAMIETVLAGGILGLAAHRNRPGPLGAACIDGFEVPLELVVEVDLPAGSFTVAELFSDGYFGTPPAGAVGIEAWEDHIRKVERDDPHKVGAYASTKGSIGGRYTDDRSVLVVYPEGAGAPGKIGAI